MQLCDAWRHPHCVSVEASDTCVWAPSMPSLPWVSSGFSTYMQRKAGEMQNNTSTTLWCVKVQHQRNEKRHASCQGSHLLVFYISITNLKASSVCVWGGGGARVTRVGKKKKEGGCIWGERERLPSDLFFQRTGGKEHPCVLVNHT